MDYDEEAELSRYVWAHYAHHMTDFERSANRAALGREKAAAADNPALARMLAERWGREGEPEIDEALALGAEQFRERACRRALAEHGAVIIINRCPRCDRVLRTPAAKQCFWCGHDWHGSGARPDPTREPGNA
jgi:hypothetical protein